MKFIPLTWDQSTLDRRAQRRAEAEVEKLKLAHERFQGKSLAGVPAVIDSGLAPGDLEFMLVMEWIDGEPITSYANKHELSVLERLELVEQVAHDLRLIHPVVLHRDLKPANILVRQIDGRHVPCVVDFGLAFEWDYPSALSDLSAGPFEVLGTVEYMAPECLWQGLSAASHASDVYGLGVVLHELLTGILPYDPPERAAFQNDGEWMRARLPAARSALNTQYHPQPIDRLARAAAASRVPAFRAAERSQELRRLHEQLDGPAGWLILYATHETVKFYRFRVMADFHLAIQKVILLLRGEAKIPLSELFDEGRPAPPRPPQRVRLSHTRNLETSAAVLQAAEALASLGDFSGAQRLLQTAPLKERWEYHLVRCLGRLREWRLGGPRNDPVTAASFHPTGEQVALAVAEGVELWQWADGGATLRDRLGGHRAFVTAVAYSPDGMTLATGSWDATARLYKPGVEGRVLVGHRGFINAVAFDPGGRRLVTASDDRTACIWDVDTGNLLMTLGRHDGRVMTAAFSPDGKLVVTGSEDREVRVWNALTGELHFDKLTGHQGLVNCVAFSANAKLIITTSWDRSARLWDARSGQFLDELKGHRGWVFSAAFSRTSQLIVTTSWDPDTDQPRDDPGGPPDSSVRLWDADTRREILQLPLGTREIPVRIRSVEFGTCGSRLHVFYQQTANVGKRPSTHVPTGECFVRTFHSLPPRAESAAALAPTTS